MSSVSDKLSDDDIRGLIANSPGESKSNPEASTSDTSAAAGLPSIEMLNLAVAGGTIPDNPAEAYRAGFIAGQKSQPKESLPLTRQGEIEKLRRFQFVQGGLFVWAANNLQALEAHLKPGDEIVQIFADSVRIAHADGHFSEWQRAVNQWNK